MKLVRIERQKKDNKRYSLFTENGFLKGISEDTLVKYGLRAGDELTEERLGDINNFDDFSAAKTDAYRFISYKARSESEVAKKLRARKYAEHIIASVTELLKQQKYLDDTAYAENYIAEALRLKPSGRSLLKKKLLLKGIDKEIADEALDDFFSGGKEDGIARSVLLKYLKRTREDDKRKLKSKCFRHLVGKGFGIDTASEVVNVVLENKDN